MRVLQIFTCLALFLAATGPAAAGEISPPLARQLDATPAGDPVTVLVYLHGGVDVAALDRSLHQDKARLADRHRIVVQSLRDAAGSAQADLVADLEAAKRTGGIVAYRAYWIINAVRLTADVATIRTIAARADVESVEPDLRVELIEPVARAAADTRGIGITPGLVNINARRVWDELGIRGEGALIGSLDTGVDGNHPALADRWRGLHAPWQECWLDVLDTGTEFPTDVDGHGTHCTGTMTGVAADDTIGVAPAAEWIAANAIDQSVNPGFDADIIACFEWFTDPDGDPETLDDVPDVVQNSWGVYSAFGYPECDSRWWDVIDACEAAGPVVVFAAGNEGPYDTTLRSPADRATSLTNCFSVGATLHSPPYTIANFSSRGPAGRDCGPEENRIKPEISGPGVDIYSASTGGGYHYLSGTSMATPHVCGVVALMRSANPDADVITIKEVLMGTSVDLGETGEDNVYGHGFVDAYTAVVQIMGGFGQVEGIVSDGPSGDPVAGARVKVLGGYQDAVTDDTGFFSLGLPEGPQIIEVSAYSYEILHEPVIGIAGETVIADLPLTSLPRVTLSGTVYLPGGTPAPGATVSVADAPEPAVTADGAGRYAIDLPIGRDFQVVATSGLAGRLTVTVPIHGDLDLDLFLNEGNAEGFESGDLAGFGWSTAGAAPWLVQGDEVVSGDWAARSGAIGDGVYSQIHRFINCGDGGDVSMWLKVSSEADDDFLQIFRGSILLGEWSGEVDWTQVTLPMTAGTNHFRVRYQKGASGASGADAAWVDDLIFPGLVSPVPKLVAAPDTAAVELNAPDQVSVPVYLFNMGGEELTWTASESAPWLTISPVTGLIPPGGYQELTYAFDAAGLLDGVHQALVTVVSNDAAHPTQILVAQLTLDTDTTASPGGPPQAFALLGAVPNPFNPSTTLRFALPQRQHVVLGLYDVRGRLVRQLIDAEQAAGLHAVRWDGRDEHGRGVASGTYFARLRGAEQTSVRSVMLVR